MKKYFIVLLLSMVGMTMYAQKGMKGIGANVAAHYGTEMETVSYGVDLKYQYHVSDYGRIEPFASIYMNAGNDGMEVDSGTEFMIGINYHQFLNGIKRTRPYFIIGAAYGSVRFAEEKGSGSYSESVPVARAGFGLDYRISHTLSLQVEASAAHTFDDYIGLLAPQIKLGLTYNF